MDWNARVITANTPPLRADWRIPAESDDASLEATIDFCEAVYLSSADRVEIDKVLNGSHDEASLDTIALDPHELIRVDENLRRFISSGNADLAASEDAPSDPSRTDSAYFRSAADDTFVRRIRNKLAEPGERLQRRAQSQKNLTSCPGGSLPILKEASVTEADAARQRERSADAQKVVFELLRLCVEGPMPTASSFNISAPEFYATWGGLTGASTGTANGLSVEHDTSEKVPDAGYFGMITTTVGLLRVVDGLSTYDGLRSNEAAYQREVQGSRHYMAAGVGIRMLEKLLPPKADPTVPLIEAPAEQKLDDMTVAFIEGAIQKLEEQKANNRKYFAINMSARMGMERSQIGAFRDGVIASINCANYPSNMVSAGLKGAAGLEKLTGQALQFANATTGIGAGVGIVSGTLSFAQGLRELWDARKEKKALKEAKRFDKEIYAQHGRECPELLDLIDCRQGRRDLYRSLAILQKYHGIARLSVGGVNVFGNATSMAFFAAGTIGFAAGLIPGIVMGSVGAAFLLWINIKTAISNSLNKNYQKAQNKINTNDKLTPDQFEASVAVQTRKSTDTILAGIVARLADDARREPLRNALLDMGIDASVIDSAHKDDGKRLREQLFPAKGIHVDEKEALRHAYQKNGATARDQLLAVQAYSADEPKHIDSPPEAIEKKWSKYVASGRDMNNIAKSKFTQALIRKHWNDDGFQAFLQGSLEVAAADLTSPDEAWALLKTRKDALTVKNKEKATVYRWVEEMDHDAIRDCIQSAQTDAVTQARKDTLRADFGLDSDTVSIRKTLHSHVNSAPLNKDTIRQFIAAYKGVSSDDKDMSIQKVRGFVELAAQSMPTDEVGAFMHELIGKGHTSAAAINENNVDAVLGRIEKFLQILDTLQGQTLTKVVASLHTYPKAFSGIPDGIARFAALRVILTRYKASPKVSQEDMDQAMVVVKALSREKLHSRTIGAGAGGGFLSFGGYKLNDKGTLALELLERCIDGGSSRNGFAGKSIPAYCEQIKDPAVDEALRYWIRKFVDVPSTHQLDTARLVRFVDAARNLDAAMRQAPPGRWQRFVTWITQPLAWIAQTSYRLFFPASYRKEREEARAVKPFNRLVIESKRVALLEKLNTAIALLDSGNPTEMMKVDEAQLVNQMTEFFAWEELAKKHGVRPLKPVEGELKGFRFDFYRAALTWPNGTARRKNAEAIRRELSDLKSGGPKANAYWSAKFLASRPEAERAAELTRLNDAFRFSTEDGSTYKKAVSYFKTVRDFSPDKLREAILGGGVTGLHWVEQQLEMLGLKLPDSNDFTPRIIDQELKNFAINKNMLGLYRYVETVIHQAFEDRLSSVDLTKPLPSPHPG